MDVNKLKCSKCEIINNYYHNYCYNCGNKLKEETENNNLHEEVLEPVPVLMASDEQNINNHKVNIYIPLSICVILISLVVFGYKLLMLDKSNKNSVIEVDSTATLASEMPEVSAKPDMTTMITPQISSTALPLPIKLELIVPKNGTDSTENDTYTVTLETNGDSIYINGDKTDKAIDVDGTMEINLQLKSGVNSFIIIATDKSGQEIQKTISIEKLLPSVALTLVNNQVLSTAKNMISISGVTEPNSKITLTTDLQYKSPIAIDQTGRFTIDLTLPVIPGNYMVIMTSTLANYHDGTISFNIERLLDEKAYRNSAISCKYNSLVNNPDSYINKVLTFTGIVDSFPDNSDSKKFVFRMGGKSSQMVYIEYIGSTKMTKGASRLLCGEYAGTFNGMPKIIARLGYKISTDIIYIE